MTFVNNDMRIFGQDFTARGDVRKKQRVIDDEHVRGLGCSLCAMEWTYAARAFDARFSGASVILSRHSGPHLALGRPREIDLASICALVRELPHHDLCQYPHELPWYGSSRLII